METFPPQMVLILQLYPSKQKVSVSWGSEVNFHIYHMMKIGGKLSYIKNNFTTLPWSVSWL